MQLNCKSISRTLSKTQMAQFKIDFKIRRPIPGEELQIAQVHIQSWQEAYRDLLPKSYLAQLPSELEERHQMWLNILKNPKRWAWVAEVGGKIVGFSLFGPPRDSNRENYIELGAKFTCLMKTDQIAGQNFQELGYAWESLNIG